MKEGFEYFRMESAAMNHAHGIAKVLGSVVGVSGALVFAFVKGPHLKFINWYPESNKGSSNSTIEHKSKNEWVQGSLMMLAANTAWSLWLILQVDS